MDSRLNSAICCVGGDNRRKRDLWREIGILPPYVQSSRSSKGDSQIPRFRVEHTLDKAGEDASRNSSSLNAGTSGKERLSVVVDDAGGGLTHVAELSSRAIFENELEDGNEIEAVCSIEFSFLADRTFLRPRSSSGRAERFGDTNSSRDSRLGCMFSAPVSEKEPKLDDMDDDLAEVVEQQSVECEIDAERLIAG